MRKKWWIFLVAPPAFVLFAWVFGELITYLWNWLMPELFGLRRITFWQALGLLVLCRILLGGIGPGPNRSRMRERRLADRWEHMTPDEREKLRGWIRVRSGEAGPPSNQTHEPA